MGKESTRSSPWRRDAGRGGLNAANFGMRTLFFTSGRRSLQSEVRAAWPMRFVYLAP